MGEDVEDADGVPHPGVIHTPLPVLTQDAEALARLLSAVATDEEMVFVDFSSLAQSCKVYDEYIERMAATPTDALEPVGVAMDGPKKNVNKLVGSLPLLR